MFSRNIEQLIELVEFCMIKAGTQHISFSKSCLLEW